MENQTQKKRNTRNVIYAGIIFLCVSAAMIIFAKVPTFRIDELTLTQQMRQQRLGKEANNAPRTVTPRAAVSQVSPKMSEYREQRTKLIQKLDTLRQKRNANTAAFEAAKLNLHNGGVDKLERLTNEYSDILEDMQEVKRQINKMGE